MKPRDDNSHFELLRILVFLQVAIAAVTAIEAMVIGTLFGAGGSGVATLVAALLTALLYIGLGRRSPRSRRWLIRFQFGWITLAVVDLALAIFLAQRGLEVIPLLTRIALPIAIWRIARRPEVQMEFWPTPNAEERAAEEVSYAMA